MSKSYANGVKKSRVLKAGNVIFGTLIHEATATIVAEQGMVVLHVKGDDNVYFPPAGVYLPNEVYGSEVSILIRNITKEVILEPAEDDIYEEDLYNNDKLVPVDDWDAIDTLLNECKIRAFNRHAKSLSTCIAGILFSVVCFILHLKGFVLPFAPMIPMYTGIALGLLVAFFFGIKPFTQLVHNMSTTIICDSQKNYIDTATGRTNMNGGMTLPL